MAQWGEHKAEAASVDWNLVAKDTFVSASWDSTIKVHFYLCMIAPPVPLRPPARKKFKYSHIHTFTQK